MIDRWMPHKSTSPEYPGDLMQGASQKDHDEAIKKATEATRFAGARAAISRGASSDCVGRFADEFFDFVFIDAEHSYKAVSKDVDMWYPKVKQGGLLCGHDWDHKRYGAFVKRAVDEFAERNDLAVDYDNEKCWFVSKPHD